MRLSISRSKNAASYYIIKTVYINGKEKTEVVEKLGTEQELREKLDGADPEKWARDYVSELNKKEQEETRPVLLTFQQSRQIEKDEQHSFNGGYLFLQQLYYKLGLHKICKTISEKHKFTYDLNAVLSRLIYGRILFPSSKLNTLELSRGLLEPPAFELQHIYRALSVIAAESDSIQAELYKNSRKLAKRNDKVLYYDCTNYYFEIEEEEDDKRYGVSKEHRPNPIVQMGLFIDGDGIPLAFSLGRGNQNEQETLQPLEKKILRDFSLSKFIVCTDAGLSSTANRKFNDRDGRAFITTQPIKKLKKHLKQWALAKEGWSLEGVTGTFDLNEIEESEELRARYKNAVFYKERWIKENGLEQHLVVTFSLKYKDYQRTIRQRQIDRATKAVDQGARSLTKPRQNDYKRFITKTNVTADGEVAEKEIYRVDDTVIAREEVFDGFYAVCTNLEDEAPAIARINKQRWKIEECFRLLKTDFEARPVYLSRKDRIEAHFTTCFLALTLFRYLEKDLNDEFTSTEIITQLREMNFLRAPGEGYIPAYTRTDFTDALHHAFGFRTDYEIVTESQMKKIFKATKN